MSFLITFLPWIVYSFLGGHTAASQQRGTLAALAVTVLVIAYKRRAGSPFDALIIETGSAVFFAATAAVAFAAPHSGVLTYSPALSSTTLAVIAWASLAARHPFTLGIAKQTAPREVWSQPAFMHSNMVITAIWAVSLTVSAAILAVAVHAGAGRPGPDRLPDPRVRRSDGRHAPVRENRPRPGPPGRRLRPPRCARLALIPGTGPRLPRCLPATCAACSRLSSVPFRFRWERPKLKRTKSSTPNEPLSLQPTGLDVFEFLAMGATGFALHRRLATAVVPAAITGTLLVCDAWINVVPANAVARPEAFAMAFVEIPLAGLSFWTAARVAN